MFDLDTKVWQLASVELSRHFQQMNDQLQNRLVILAKVVRTIVGEPIIFFSEKFIERLCQ